MNAFTIIGFIISIVGSVVGSVLIFYGNHLQALAEENFQNIVIKQVEVQKAQDRPEIVALQYQGSPRNSKLTIKNIGNRNATNVKLIFLEESTPSFFVSNQIYKAQEIPKGTDYCFEVNLFFGLDNLLSLPNKIPEHQTKIMQKHKRFLSGEMAFIPRFKFYYSYDGKDYESSTYYLILANNKVISFGKED